MPSNITQYRTEAYPNTPTKRTWPTGPRLSPIQASPSSLAQGEATSQRPSPSRPGLGESITVRLTPEDPGLQEALHYAVTQGWVYWSADYATLNLSLQQAQNELADTNTDREMIYQLEKELEASKMTLKAREETVAMMEKGVQEQHRMLSLRMLELASTVGARSQAVTPSASRGPGRGRRRRGQVPARPGIIWDERGTKAGAVYHQRGVPGEEGRGRKKWWEFWNKE